MTTQHNYFEITRDKAREVLADAGHKAFRAKQLADWVYNKGVTDPTVMSNLPAAVTDEFSFLTSSVAQQADSSDGTTKLLLNLSDNCQIETVLIPSEKRATACVSTQAGCAIGCKFCASGLGGLQRNISTGEILQQLIHLRQTTGTAPTNVVFMGMGEPLANYEASIAAIRAIIDPDRFGISARRVTLSTIGIPSAIRRLATEDLPITLAISLHAPSDELRREIIPSAAKHSIDQILQAAGEFYEARKREVTLEYILLEGVNDAEHHARNLSRLAGRLRCNVNLIRYNPVESLPFAPSTRGATEAFINTLRETGTNATLRTARGTDIAAACGQLKGRNSRF
ncbi:MAG: 23S rRNA (adenine(2503)-C(2))-methyltransferase RlmN [Phycisphaerales bacterium]|nr:23S rRNA (adenine(2503)-C(2))-methyltransferase RlmN [Phycisphaerales bacterium]